MGKKPNESATGQGLADYIWASPSPFHCVAESTSILDAVGFTRVDEKEGPTPVQSGEASYIVRGASLIAWRAGTGPLPQHGFHIIGAHTDSPNLRLKPTAESGKEKWRQLAVEPYGGLILATWLDRDLGLSGKVVVRSKGGLEARLFRTNQPIARIPSLAIHLNRTVNTEGLKLNAQNHINPVVGLGEWSTKDEPKGFNRWLAEQMDVEEVVTWELGLHDVQPPCVGGLNNEFVFAPRLDNLGSCYPAVIALANAQTTQATQVVALFDHEECGSQSYRGAKGPFLPQVLKRLLRNHPERAPGGFERAIANSWMLSADMAHGVHPNFPNKHEPDHKPRLNGGPVIKSHAKQRYATDAESTALFQSVCDGLGISFQNFITRSDLACGSTIGPITASVLGIRTVDVGNAMLSMHSIREQAGAKDVGLMEQVMRKILER